MEYNFNEIEKKWQEQWVKTNAYKVSNQSEKPKYYVLDMFPYPSGAGLHVGHPLGYIASDIYARYKRLKGFNVLHPMGFDSFGLPAEQYALETGQHPATTTEKNIGTFKKQLDKIGFCYDWSREVRTSDPNYYKWTQWIFLELYNSFYDTAADKAMPITKLEEKFATDGGEGFTATDWANYTAQEKADVLMNYRLAFSKYGEVNWCEALNTVLANDEVVNGVSERGGHPVVKKKMRQWYLRITDYADRLLQGLEKVEFSESMKEMQRNWIGKSVGAEITFEIQASSLKPQVKTDENLKLTANSYQLEVYTTRPDTIFGVDFMVAAPELEWISDIVTPEQRADFDNYVAYVKSRSEIERMSEKKITGCFTGAFAINPFNGKQIPIWVSEYVLAGYGTGAIMAVPCGDERDFKFAQHFNIPITNIIGDAYNGEEANPTKDAPYTNSDFLNGMTYQEAAATVIAKLEERGIGKKKINFRMRDAGFSRQRYWGEPFPIQWKDGVATTYDGALPLELPHMENYGPGPEGQGPLANNADWVANQFEVNTMPGYAGSSWYFLRYMDPNNDATFCDRKASDYWNQVDLYVGGTEHAVGHLLYSRMWTKALYDLGHISFDEPFKKLLNQGMITGKSAIAKIYWGKEIVDAEYGTVTSESVGIIVPYDIDFPDTIEFSKINLPVEKISIGQSGEYILTTSEIDFLRESSPRYEGLYIGDQEFLKKYLNESQKKQIEHLNINWTSENGILLGQEVEKMSKSKLNTFNPDDLCDKYGADTFRMYEMFLGPVELSKPWDTKGIEGVHRFIRKFWRLFFDDIKGWIVNDETATDAELKVLHKAIKKVEDDTERFNYNTAVSTFMIAVNDLSEFKCNKRAILEPLTILLAPYAPHIAAELYSRLYNDENKSVLDAAFPVFEQKYLTETTKEYPVSINGKMRTTLVFDLTMDQAAIEPIVLENEIVVKWLEGKPVKKVIFVKGKMINVVA